MGGSAQQNQGEDARVGPSRERAHQEGAGGHPPSTNGKSPKNSEINKEPREEVRTQVALSNTNRGEETGKKDLKGGTSRSDGRSPAKNRGGTEPGNEKTRRKDFIDYEERQCKKKKPLR